jgi:hypothetical protein
MIEFRIYQLSIARFSEISEIVARTYALFRSNIYLSLDFHWFISVRIWEVRVNYVRKFAPFYHQFTSILKEETDVNQRNGTVRCWELFFDPYVMTWPFINFFFSLPAKKAVNHEFPSNSDHKALNSFSLHLDECRSSRFALVTFPSKFEDPISTHELTL